MNLLPGYDLSKEQRKVILLASVGGMLEFYDFTVYGLFALYFTSQFFPSHNALLSVLAGYTIFVVGYIIRPVGGVIFSHIGDEYGRKKVLIITMFLMGVASLGMGMVPTYDQVGVYAPIAMLILRLVQGLAFGGELPSMIVYTTESMPEKRGLGVGGSFSGTVCGLVLGMVVNLLLVHILTNDQLTSFGWRIPFILGGLLCIVAYKVRSELHETYAFKHMKHNIKVPLVELLRSYFKQVVIGIGLVSLVGTAIILLIVFMPTYLVKIVKMDPALIGNVVFIAAVVSVISTYLSGILVQKLNLFRITLALLIGMVPAAILCYYLISVQSFLYFGFILFAIFQGALITLPIVYLSYLFPPEVRLSGVALSYNISFVLFGGLTPLWVTGLIEKTGWLYLSPLIFLFVSIALTTISVFAARKTMNN